MDFQVKAKNRDYDCSFFIITIFPSVEKGNRVESWPTQQTDNALKDTNSHVFDR